MIIEELKSIKSSKEDLRKFGLTVGAAFVVLGGLLFFSHKGSFPYILIIGGVLIAAGLLIPNALIPIQKPWMGISIVIGFFMTQVMMGLLFFLVVTPIGFFYRLLGKDILEQKIDRRCSSYWVERKPGKVEASEYERQF